MPSARHKRLRTRSALPRPHDSRETPDNQTSSMTVDDMMWEWQSDAKSQEPLTHITLTHTPLDRWTHWNLMEAKCLQRYHTLTDLRHPGHTWAHPQSTKDLEHALLQGATQTSQEVRHNYNIDWTWTNERVLAHKLHHQTSSENNDKIAIPQELLCATA